SVFSSYFCQAEDGIRDRNVTGVQTCALPIYPVMTENKNMNDLLKDGITTYEGINIYEYKNKLREYTVGLIEGIKNGDNDCFNELDRKSTRLNSSHVSISYAVFCLKNKKLIKT